jgi:hypothetical protein
MFPVRVDVVRDRQPEPKAFCLVVKKESGGRVPGPRCVAGVTTAISTFHRRSQYPQGHPLRHLRFRHRVHCVDDEVVRVAAAEFGRR